MSIRTRSRKNIAAPQTKWDEAISDAEKRVRCLMESIAIFNKMKDDNEPWPPVTDQIRVYRHSNKS
jgi:hypothetical protein